MSPLPETSESDTSDDPDFGGQVISKRPKISLLFQSPRRLAIKKLGGYGDPLERDTEDDLNREQSSKVDS